MVHTGIMAGGVTIPGWPAARAAVVHRWLRPPMPPPSCWIIGWFTVTARRAACGPAAFDLGTASECRSPGHLGTLGTLRPDAAIISAHDFVHTPAEGDHQVALGLGVQPAQ